jgi:hypothetical protein
MLMQLEMTDDERKLASKIGEPFVKMLPDGGYLALTGLLCDQAAVHRSREGDLAGWSEEWMFDSGANAKLAFFLLLNGHEPLGWTRHGWMDDKGVSHREYPDGRTEAGA